MTRSGLLHCISEECSTGNIKDIQDSHCLRAEEMAAWDISLHHEQSALRIYRYVGTTSCCSALFDCGAPKRAISGTLRAVGATLRTKSPPYIKYGCRVPSHRRGDWQVQSTNQHWVAMLSLYTTSSTKEGQQNTMPCPT
jgi:hypothetical protein